MTEVEINLTRVPKECAAELFTYVFTNSLGAIRVDSTSIYTPDAPLRDFSAENLTPAQAIHVLKLAIGLDPDATAHHDMLRRLAEAEYLIVALTAALTKADGHLTGPDAGRLGSYSMSYLRGKA